MTIAVRGLLHVAVVTDDLDRLASFYTELFGAEEIKRLHLTSPRFAAGVGVPDGRATTVHLGIPGAQTVVELTQYHEPGRSADRNARSDTPGMRHLALRVDDIAAAVLELRDRGVEVVGGPVEMDEPPSAKGVRFLYCRDPDGNLIELIEPPAN